MNNIGRIAVGCVFVGIIGVAAISTLGTKASGTFTSVGARIGDGGDNNDAKGGGPDQAKAADPRPEPDEISRKIIYTAKATLVVGDFDKSDELGVSRSTTEPRRAFQRHGSRLTNGSWAISPLISSKPSSMRSARHRQFRHFARFARYHGAILRSEGCLKNKLARRRQPERC